jgi:response regulator RpfG family c-di-GMP phosphodiesterase/putative methionine-R-sulfoxide reductase with GAF domain
MIMAERPLLRLLLVEDSEDDALLLLREIQSSGYSVDCERVETADAMKLALEEEAWDVIISDYSLPQFSAPQALAVMKEGGYDLPFIIVSGTTTEENAVTSLKAGAHDFVIKDRLARLMPAIQRELKEAGHRHERRQRERELEAIASISAALRTAGTLDEMLSNLLENTLEVIGAQAGSIWIYDQVSNRIQLTAERGWDSLGPITTSVELGEDIPGLVVKTGEAITSRDFHDDPRVMEENRRHLPEGVGGVCIPLHSNETVVGAMFINVSLPRVITGGELRVLKALAEIGGTALHNTRLHEQTIRQLERLDTLHTIDLLISGTTDLQVTLKLLIAHIHKQLNVDAVAILLLKAGSNRLEFAGGEGFRTPNIKSTSVRIGEGYVGEAVLERHIVRVMDMDNSPQIFTRKKLLSEEKFVSYVGLPLFSKGEIIGALEIFHRSTLTSDPEWLSFVETLGGQVAIAIENSILFHDLQRSNHDLALAYDATIEGWSHALDLRDKDTEGHTVRVTEMTLKLARIMGLHEEQLIHIKRGALLHDIGKMGVPDSILLKPDVLTDADWEVMRRHPQLAYDWLAPIAFLQKALEIPYCHHEKWDGSGYPRGLKGEQIPLSARIFTVVDIWDALTSDRPYRQAWPEEEVLDYIRKNSGRHLDPAVVEVFIRSLPELR